MTTQTNPTNIPDTWENRIKQASVFLGISAENTESILNEYGVQKEPAGLEMLSDENVTPFGDLRKEFCEKNNIPVPKLRMAMKYFRGPADSQKTDSLDPVMLELQTKYGIRTRLEDLGVEELLPYYNPLRKNRVYKVLRDMFKDKKVVAFKPDSKEIAVEETINYMTDINDGLPEEESIDVDGELVRLYEIGQVPNQLVDEDPLFAGHPLKRERSMINRVNWSGISPEVRQFFRILVDRDDIDPNDRMSVRQAVEMAKNGINDLKKVFAEAYLEFKEKKTRDELPKLHLTLDEVNGNDHKQNPFGISNRRY